VDLTKPFVFAARLPNGEDVEYEGDTYEELFRQPYHDSRLKGTMCHYAGILTDIIEVKYGRAAPGLFTWTEPVVPVQDRNPNMKSTLNEVFNVVAGEMEYAIDRWEKAAKEAGVNRVPDKEKPITAWLSFMRGTLQEANKVVTVEPGANVQSYFRKLANLAMTCMKHKGAIARYPLISGDELDPAVLERNFVAPPLSFGAICQIVADERKYQDEDLPQKLRELSPETFGKCAEIKDDTAYLTMFGTYLRRADDQWTSRPGILCALNNVRKLAGIAVHALQAWGAPSRALAFEDFPVVEHIDFGVLGRVLHNVNEEGLLARLSAEQRDTFQAGLRKLLPPEPKPKPEPTS